MEKIKIVHVYKSFNVYNGLIEILSILANDLDHTRYELGVVVFEYEKNAFGEHFEKLGGKIFNLNVAQSAINEITSFNQLYDFFKTYKPHVVQTHVLKANLLGTVAARKAGVPVVIGTEMTLKDTAPSKLARIRDRFVQPITNAAIGKCDKFVVTSEFIKDQWESISNSELFRVIYPPFNLTKLNSAGKKRSGNKKGEVRIGFIGRLSDEKSVDVLLDAMKIVVSLRPEAQLSIVGTGPLEENLKNYTSSLNLQSNVTFCGYSSNVFQSLREMDIFVLSSRTEGCPIVILEAMAMGLPVVATRVGGNSELVVDGSTGLLVKHSNCKQMASAILELIHDRSRAQKMGKAGKQRAFTVFHPKKFTQSLQQLYDELYQKKTTNQTVLETSDK
ncbi:glycosyltransferase family 4 protein [Chitinispirillales bacterium ANBcel5]|uniref:glycosyltransferase family 4 protein n=1 Tax=Cellulosispirillum alkaliphilum TaxID=3039283 RepID=UPI002A51863C|nr:glycosyltransferase family 4 protein [Chitinispirillales bacterium ANBcel5]